jgi:cytochrome P450
MHPAPDKNIPILNIDPFSAETLANPRPYQQALREAGPVVWLSHYGFYAVGGYEEVAAVLSDWKTFTSARGVGTTDLAKQAPWWGERAVLIESDPPRHNEIKAHVMKVYNPRAVADLGVEFKRQADALLDEVLAKGTFDGHKDIAAPYPLKVFGDALGIDRENRDILLTFGDLVFNNFGPKNEIVEKAWDTANKVGAVDWMRSRTAKEAVKEGSLGQQLHDLSDTGELTPAESANVMRGQLAAGVDTTVAAIGYTLYCFAKNPDQFELVRNDPSLAVKAFEEAVRLLSPLQTILRTTTTDTEIGGLPVRADHKIIISNAAANRDPRKFENPEKFDVTRNVTGHVGFGRGVHTCVGMHVAKLEAEQLLTSLAERTTAISLNGPIEFKLNNTVRSLVKLPLSVKNK